MQNRYIVTAAAAVLIVVLALITYGVLDQNVFAYNRAVAKVGDDKISVAEFEDQVRITRQQLILQFQQYQQLAVFFGDDSMARQVAAQLENNQTANEQVGEQALTYLIDTKLIRQEAERRGITVSQEEIDARMRDWFGYYPDGTPTVEPTVTVWPTSTLSAQQMTLVPPTATPTATVEPTLDPTAAAAAPTEAATPTEVVEPTSALPTPTALNPDPTTTPMPTPTPLTEQGYRDRIQDALEPFKGKRVDEGDLRRLVENSLYSEKLINELTVDIKQDQEMVWARHILVEDEATAQQVLTELKNGGDFAQLASQYSSDGSKDQGGDLDWFPRGQMVKEFEDVAFSLEIGQISDPVQSQFGFHIIQVLGHEVRQLSAEQLDQLKRNAYDKWLEEARANTTIERYDEVWKERIPTDPSLEEALAAQQQEQQGQPGQQ